MTHPDHEDFEWNGITFQPWHDDDWVPMFGLAWLADYDGLQLRVTYGGSFAAPIAYCASVNGCRWFHDMDRSVAIRRAIDSARVWTARDLFALAELARMADQSAEVPK